MSDEQRRVEAPKSRRRRRTRRVGLANIAVETHGLPQRVWQDLYHLLMTVSWPRLFAFVAVYFTTFNLIFAYVYHLSPGSIANLNPPGYAGEFFFSVETLATVGYGDMHPQTPYGHVVAALEILVGVVHLAVLTGVVFARFSRPTARFLFARHAVVRPFNGRPTLMFRAGNGRQNVIVDASARLRLLVDTVSSEGYEFRRIIDLKLARDQHPLFILGWNLLHVIDGASPLADATPESLAESNAVFSLTLSGTDETTGQVLMGRAEYLSDAIRWNHTFRDVLSTGADGTLHYDYTRFNDVEPLPDPPADLT